MTIESEAQIAPSEALGTIAIASQLPTGSAGELPGSLSSRRAKSNAGNERQKAAKSRTFVPALPVFKEPPTHLTSRRAKGSVPWADWHFGRCADVVRQIRKDGLLVGDGPAINPGAFDAYVEYVVLALAGVSPDLYGAGFLRLMLAERSFQNRPKDENNKRIPNAVEVCNPKASKRKVGAKKKEKGPLAIRSRLSSEAIYRLNRKREAAGLLTIERSSNPVSKEQGPNNYSFGENFLNEIGRYIRSEGHRFAAEIVLAAFVLSKIQRNKGYAEFARQDLTTCGLDRLHFADAGLKRILSRYDQNGVRQQRGLFDVIGEGRVTLPELVDLGHFKGLDASMIWPRLEASPGSSRSVTQPVLNDHPDPLLEQSPGSSQTITRPRLEASPGPVLNDHPYEQLEGFEQQEVGEQQEEINGALSHPVESNRIHGAIEPHEPDYGSGTPSPPSGSSNGRADEGEFVTPASELAAHGSFVDRLIEAVGSASPTKPGKHRPSIEQCATAIDALLSAAGLSKEWAIDELRLEVDRLTALGVCFRCWGNDAGGVRKYITRAVARRARTAMASPSSSSRSTIETSHAHRELSDAVRQDV